MTVCFSTKGWEDYVFWQTADKKTLLKINKLIEEIKRTPCEGTGHPEPLRNELTGFWSRRITQEHRLIYMVTDDGVKVAQCRYHY